MGEWCVFQNKLGIWQKSLTHENREIPNGALVKLFDTENEASRFLKFITRALPPKN